MFNKTMVTLAVMCLALICLTRNSEGKPFDLDDLQDDSLLPKVLDRRPSKREIQTVGMSTWEYCYRIRNRSPLCRNLQTNVQTPRIKFITV